MVVWIDNMKSDVALDHLGHQAVYGAAASGHRVQNIRTIGVVRKRPFDGGYLPLDAPNPVQQLFFVANDVGQLDNLSFSMIIYPGWYSCQRPKS
jgi:hypothetical protein